VYDGFTTAHSLFGIPVLEDSLNYDHEALLTSNIKPQRLELLANTSLLIWDEFLSNHKQCFRCAYDITDQFKNMVVICMGDYRQIAPVVIHGQMPDIINASPISSDLWNEFTIRTFSINMRLQGIHHSHHHCNDDQQRRRANGDEYDYDDDEGLMGSSSCTADNNPNVDHDSVLLRSDRQTSAADQLRYAQMLLEIGEGGNCNYTQCDYLDDNPHDGSTILRLPLIQAETDMKQALQFMYPTGFDPFSMHKSSILAGTNDTGDLWNQEVQALNPATAREYLSADIFDEIDDPNGWISEMMTTEALNSFTRNGCPPHKLLLKVDDICIILRNINKRDGLTNNTRVRILHLDTFNIRVQTLDTVPPKCHVICRIKFNFKIPFGNTFTMTRTQFPLRLAYCMSFNKAQGQEFDRVLADIRQSPFSHGHLYVVASRIRNSKSIRMFCEESQIIEGFPFTTNVVYTALKLS
jgi:hypothetical protein